MNVLDRPVPRRIVDQVIPETFVQQTDIAELREDKIIHSLEMIPESDTGRHIAKLVEQNLKWQTVDLPDKRVEILYYDELNDEVRDAIALRLRDLGLEEPALSINEHIKLGRYYGGLEALQLQDRRPIEYEGRGDGNRYPCNQVYASLRCNHS